MASANIEQITGRIIFFISSVYRRADGFDQVQQRLESLRQEYAKGEQMLQDLEREAQQIRDSLLRIAGAIQVLEELQQGAGAVGGVDGDADGDADGDG